MTRDLLGTVAALALLAGGAAAQDTDSGTDAAQAGGARITIEECAPVVTVTQTPPQVMITMPESEGGEPRVSVTQAAPEVTVETCEPTVTLTQDGAEAEAQTQFTAAEPELQIRAAETAELTVSRHADGSAESAASAGGDQDGAAQEPEAEGSGGDDTADGESDPAADSGDAETDSRDAADGEGEVALGQAGAVADTDPDPAEAAAAASDGPGGESIVTTPDEAADSADETASTDEPAEPVSREAGGTGVPGAAAVPQLEGDATDPAADLTTPEDRSAAGQVARAGDNAETAMPDDDAGTTTESDAETAADGGAAEGVVARAEPIALREGRTMVDVDEVVDAGLDGLVVFSADDEEIGEIDRFDTEGRLAVIAVGGFLGLGERDVALPLDEISFQRDGDGDVRAYIGLASEQIEGMPPYQPVE
ncbi:PRC-barrel domain-containing protein [Paracoccus salsus]|uniref:PRC-barrel domain-containing protein n=1 Tax=Paracoccus salsus TaxID=2911061 RepID=UPI001F1FB7A9|nr:PRC-barrel domain-containing protein [Paracoccus salsus]MCF3972059.1 PRC-barrel domain-containing protein [Paracoccus salsus]